MVMELVMIAIVVVMGLNADYQQKKIEKEKQAAIEQLKDCKEKCAVK